MASSPTAIRTGQRPRSVQPGGGWVMHLEQWWGRCRRGWLRRLRPGYVGHMLAKRQGYCPDCSHDIIDPRDLKYVRNVCGYWFHPEDDAFGWRNRLGFARYGLVEVIWLTLLYVGLAVPLMAGALAWHWSLWIALGAATALWLEVLWFFRDPPRRIPDDPRALVSPADGLVTHIGEIDDPDFPGGRAFRISIFLSILNVHVNRLSRSGRVVDVRYFPGEFLDARHTECPKRNEQLWIDLEEPGGRTLRIKQISGKLARRIICWLKIGETVHKGERLGMIKFGSRTEVLLPVEPGLEVVVKEGGTVKGGSSILLRFP
jgi:phosphatidylserine decarboxylase